MDMTDPDTPDIDRRLREAFDGDVADAARVARAALADEDARAGHAVPRSRRRWTAVAAGAAVLLVASAFAFWPARRLAGPFLEPPSPPSLSGSITDGALVVLWPDGSTSISWGGARDDRPPDGSGIVIVEGVVK
jgi:hypothetical protein